MIEETRRQVQETMGRIMEMCGEVPAPFERCGIAPAFLQDLYINFKRYVWNDGYLNARDKAAIAYAVSFYRQSSPWSEFFADRMRKLGLSQGTVDDVRGIVSTCTAYNTFFSFTELAGIPFNGMSVGLRGHSWKGTEICPALVELIAIAISTLNACRTCTVGHVNEARGRQVPCDAIMEAVQCAATVHAGCTFLS